MWEGIPTDAAGATSEYGRRLCDFCSGDCRALFTSAPQKYGEVPHRNLVEAGGTIHPRLPYG
ncbi:hypothetical protein HFX_2677 [Haloferax mediterranei ATCC 33500]|uniref:YHS domain-containing protein n=1 Tax=Haloferax mediterranei (strain ATCC 33500 / DSM 1411 / JCM 8866 / NBRC 14739 / NCIMB 2177 / R-4) TaxID=523841 RepID=I3R7Z5_HALMT|nr:hypothetical protein HFX_2677 [Haloferax mediterranei ATCC 33500]